MNADRDKLIAAVYSVSMSPQYFDESLDTIDALLFDNLAEDTQSRLLPNGGVSESINGQSQPNIDPEILHHVARANEINDRLGRQRIEQSRPELLLATAPNPAFIFDHGENIIAMNDLAKNNNGNEHTRKLADYCTSLDVLDRIRKFMANPKHHKLMIEPGYINEKQNVNTCIFVRKIDGSSRRDVARRGESLQYLYFFTMVNLGFDDSKTELFKKTYGLTQAEVEVAIHLASGLQIPEIAEKRDTKIVTIRSQVKAIKSKTQSRDLASIVRLVCGFSAGILTSSQLAQFGEPAPKKPTPLKTQKQITLTDGRSMSYLEQGAPAGSPVLLLHTIPYGGELLKEASAKAKQMNLRLISPYRPGYGKSDALRNVSGEQCLDTVAADMCELLDRLDIPKAAIVGVAPGSLYAMRFASLYPNRVSHLFAVSRTPMWRDAWIAQGPKRQRLLIRLARYTPKLVPLVLRAAMAYIDKGQAQDLFKTACADSAADMRALNTPEISGLMEKEFVEGQKQGWNAQSRDTIMTVTDFSQEASRLTHKFHILHGDDDKVIDIAQSQAFADLVPGTELEIVKGAGHLLIYSHWERVLEAIKKKTQLTVLLGCGLILANRTVRQYWPWHRGFCYEVSG